MSFDKIRLDATATDNKGSILAHEYNPKTGKSTLVIRYNTHNSNLRNMNSRVNNAHKSNYLAPKNMKEAVVHEYGHLLHHKLKLRSAKAYAKLEKDLAELDKNPNKKTKVSGYSSKVAKERGVHNEVVAESIVYIVSGRKPRVGKDTINVVRSAFEKSELLKTKAKLPSKKKSIPKKVSNFKVAVKDTTKKVKTTSSKSKDLLKKARAESLKRQENKKNIFNK